MFPMNLYNLTQINDKPPTLYALLNSICNFEIEEKEDITKTKDLAKIGRTKIFDFDYPLTTKINKEDFESMILNKFIMRRIGFETPTAFKIQLNVKLNEIMPIYNKMFEMLDGWDIFNDGEEITRETTTNNINDYEGHKINSGTNTTENTGTNTIENSGTNKSQSDSTINGNQITDNRNSDLPQNEISNVADGNYMTNYQLTDVDNTGIEVVIASEDLNSKSKNTIDTQNKNTIDLTEIGYNTTKNNGTVKEVIKRTPSEKLELYTKFIKERTNIYSMIFKDLDCLFYQLI